MSIRESSKYTQYLPRIYQKSHDETDTGYFLGRFLKAFEKILAGDSEIKEEETLGIEEILDRFDRYLDPYQTPAQFLKWLARWVGLELEESADFYGEADHSEKGSSPTQILPLDDVRSSINRNMIGMMVQLYKKRGTRQGLLEYLRIYAGEEPTFNIDEYEETARVGKARGIGINTMIGSSKPNFFSVHAVIPAHSRSILEKEVRIIRKVIENEKPFYTNYMLNVDVPAMRVGVCSRVGRETLLGGMVED